MHVCTTAIVGMMLAWQPPVEKFTFVMSPTTQKHIAIQPQFDHHRIHFLVRTRDLQGKAAFARVVCEVRDADGQLAHKSMSLSVVNVETDNDLWSFYFRVPRFSDQPATYQVEVGSYTPAEVVEFPVTKAFAWKVDRNAQGEAQFLHELPEGGVVSLGITTKVAKCVGGSIKIFYEKRVAASPGIVFGIDRTGDQALIDGGSVAQKVN